MKAVWFGSPHTTQFELTGLGLQFRWPDAEMEPTADLDEALRLIGMDGVELALAHVGKDIDAALEFIEEARANSELPLLAVVGPEISEVARVKALRQGADGLLFEPCPPMETQAIIVALLRRHRSSLKGLEDMIEAGDLSICPATCEVFLKGETVRLTPTELRLLLALARRKGAVATFNQLIQPVWGELADGATLRKYIQRLRQKLGDSSDRPRLIVNVPAVGYRLLARPEARATPERRAS